MSDYGHEDVVNIKKVQKLKKQYQKPFMVLLGVVFIAMIFLIYDDETSESVDNMTGLPISRTIGFIVAVPLLIVGFRSTWLKIGDVYYFKTVLTTKWDYDQYGKAMGWKKWFT